MYSGLTSLFSQSSMFSMIPMYPDSSVDDKVLEVVPPSKSSSRWVLASFCSFLFVSVPSGDLGSPFETCDEPVSGDGILQGVAME